MKKLFTSLLMLGCMVAASAEVTLQKGAEGSVVYHDGDVITVGYKATVNPNTGAVLNYTWDPELYINSTSTCRAEVTLASDATVQFCGFDDSCITTAAGPVHKSVSLSAKQPQNMRIDMMVPKTLPETEQEATITVEADGAELVFTLKFAHEEETAGLDQVATASTAISVNGRILNYSVASPVTLTVYTIAGQPAMTRSLAGHGSVSLDALPGGVYLYRAGTRTGKFVVR